MTVRRGTSNGNKRGSAEQRRKRKLWLLEKYRANVDVVLAPLTLEYIEVPLGEGKMACRCYRCGRLLTFVSMTVDKIIPQCEGGTYRRTNIRPACALCNSETGGALAHRKKQTKPSFEEQFVKAMTEPMLEFTTEEGIFFTATPSPGHTPGINFTIRFPVRNPSPEAAALIKVDHVTITAFFTEEEWAKLRYMTAQAGEFFGHATS